MQLYSGTTQQFVKDATHNAISDKLQEAFTKYYGRHPGPSEVTSWTNSLQFLKNAIEENKLLDNAVILEYELPYSNRRIDCVLFGQREKLEKTSLFLN
jgi:hypothetical protein